MTSVIRPRPISVHLVSGDHERLVALARRHSLSTSEVVRLALMPVLAGRCDQLLADASAAVVRIADRTARAEAFDNWARICAPAASGSLTDAMRRLTEADSLVRQSAERLDEAIDRLARMVGLDVVGKEAPH